jgi:ubiquinone/menaquinone biosynthesis C-methylase UbiE
VKGEKQDEVVRTFYDQDSVRYLRERYPDEARTCSQYSYLIRKVHVLRMLNQTAKGSGRLLDIGCGPGVYTRDLLRLDWQVAGMDLSPHMIGEARSASAGAASASPATFAAGHAARLPFKTSSFDCVLCIGVISYVDDIRVALAEI